jgi:ATP-dependent Clp protease ATP-binding subunit ClpX
MTEENTLTNHCTFCGNSKEIVKKLVVSEKVAICNDCVALCQTLIDDELEPATTEEPNFDPESIRDYLNLHVIGQDDAKMVLSVAIANHYKRINNPPKDIEIQKGNVLIIGPTGSGKTLLAKTAAKYLKVPFVVADATSLTEAGYVGDDVESMISMLINAAGGDVKLAERGIIFVDEIDKIARKGESASITRDVSGEGVQQALLKMVEGSTMRIPKEGGRKHPGGDMSEINTKDILFIAGGAFVGLKDVIANRMNGTSIGFSATINDNKLEGDLSKVSPDDLTKYGMIPEFIGRFTTTVSIDELNKEQLVQILTSVKNNYISQYKYLLSLDNITLTFTDGALDQIAENTLTLKTGARGLHTEIERVLMCHMFYTKKYKDNNITTLNIDMDQVLDPKPLYNEKRKTGTSN